jgi:hypothetical protein
MFKKSKNSKRVLRISVLDFRGFWVHFFEFVSNLDIRISDFVDLVSCAINYFRIVIYIYVSLWRNIHEAADSITTAITASGHSSGTSNLSPAPSR